MCEAQPELAWKINRDTTQVLAELAADIPLVFLSTDLVFDGREGNYSEADAPNPLTVYGKTKVAAEKAVLANPKHIVIRTSLTGGGSPTGDRGFDEQLRNAWRAGKVPQLFTDEFRSPIMARVTARAIWELAAVRAAGLFHLAGSERLSRFEMGRLVAARCPELHPRIAASSIRDYPGPPRSADTSLDCARVQRLLSFPLPRFTDSLEEDVAKQRT